MAEMKAEELGGLAVEISDLEECCRHKNWLVKVESKKMARICKQYPM